MDVGGTRHGGVLDDPVEEFRGGRLASHALRAHDSRGLLGRRALEHLAQVATIEEMRAADGELRRQVGPHRKSRQACDLVADAHVPRIPHRDVHAVVGEVEGHEDPRARVLFRHGMERPRPHVAHLQVDEADPPTLSELLQQEAERDSAPLGHRALERDPQPRGHRARSIELGRLHQLEAGDDESTQLVLGHAKPGHRATLMSAGAPPAPPPPSRRAPASRRPS